MYNLFIGEFSDKDKEKLCSTGSNKKAKAAIKKDENKEYYDKKKKK